MKRFLHAILGVGVLISMGSGCGPEAPTETPGKLGTAGPNSHLKIKDEYKQTVDKDGHMIMKPGMKKPGLPATPKS